MKSFSEIETNSKRASKAIGFSWGIAEEVGKCIRLLELFGLAGVENLNLYYKLRLIKKYEEIKIIKKINNSSRIPYCPIIVGVSFLDQIKKLEKFKKISFNRISYPLLILPFLSRSSEILGKKIHLKFDDCEFLLNFNVNILSNLFNKKCPSIANNVQIYFLENKDNFSRKEWGNLTKLSEKTFVEETESLKNNAAGAGLTDND